MKQVDFNKKFKDFNGVEIGNRTISEELALALYNAGIPELPISNEEKFRAYKLSTKLISQNGVVELSNEDVTFLNTFSSHVFAAGAYGQILELTGG